MDFRRYQKRINIVCRRYFKDSLKNQTRIGRGIGAQINFNDDTPFPSDFQSDFPYFNENKNALNECLAQKLICTHSSSQNQVSVSFKDGELVSEGDIGSDRVITNYTSEKEDARVVRHAMDAVSEGFSPNIILA